MATKREDEANRKSLTDLIDQWIDDQQNESGEPLDMWISDTLAAKMATAAWAVLDESRATQDWLKKEGHLTP